MATERRTQELTHTVPPGQPRGSSTAACGTLQARAGDPPTCADCRAIDADDERTAAGLRQDLAPAADDTDWPTPPEDAPEAPPMTALKDIARRVLPFAAAAPTDVVDQHASTAELVTSLERSQVTLDMAKQGEDVIERAAGLKVVDTASCQLGEDLYDILRSFEATINEHYGPHCDRAHKTWKGLTDERAKYLRPIEEAKKALGERVAGWKLKVKRDEERQQREFEERARQEQLAQAARDAEALAAQGRADEAARVVEEAKTAPAPMLPRQPSQAPTTGKTTTAGKWIAEFTDWPALRAAIGAGTFPEFDAALQEAVLPLLNRQATVLKGELGKRYPGVQGREKGQLRGR